MNELKGLGTALITPFDAQGKVDYEALARLLDTQLTGFVDYLVVLGTTGEAATMMEDEKREVRTFIRKYVNGRLPLVLGVGGNCTAVVCESLRTIDLSGFEAILSVCPYYNKPNQEGLYQHFCKVAETSPIPVILYNVPGRTGVNLLPETVMRIYNAYPEKIIGIKEASGNLEQCRSILARKPEGFVLLSGNDEDTFTLMQEGAEGVISVASNVFPSAMADFVRALKEGRMEEAARMQERLLPLFKALFVEPNPIPAKAAMAQLGLMENSLRLPLVKASPATEALIKQTLQQLF